MLSNNPSLDRFKILFSDDFFIKEITDKYDMILKQKNYVLTSIKDMILESIKNVETPSFGFEPIEQNQIDGNNAGYSNTSVAKTSEQKLVDSNTINITFRHTDGFITYWCLLELFAIRFMMGQGSEKFRKPFTNIILENYYTNGNLSCRVLYNKVMLKSLPSIMFAYDTPERNILEFGVSFHFETFQPQIEIQSLLLKNK